MMGITALLTATTPKKLVSELMAVLVE